MKGYILVISTLIALLLVSGCSSYYQSIPKDTVMVKKIAQVEPEKKVENPGVLSEDTVKTLSLNAINKFYNTNFSFEDVSLQVNFFDLKQVKNMLYSFLGDSDVDPLVQYKTELSNISSGLYSVSVTNQYTSQVEYATMVNATNGDVLEVQKYGINRSDDDKSNNSTSKDEALARAKQVLDQMENMDILELGQPKILKSGRYSLVFYEDKKTQNDGIVFSFDSKSKELWSYSKGITTILSYSYLSKYK